MGFHTYSCSQRRCPGGPTILCISYFANMDGKMVVMPWCSMRVG
uniref:Uncharacterized protein n=1 Tax=Anguilla anguilla TaxID=7936 RepID=A0A0E9SV65_ANGAN